MRRRKLLKAAGGLAGCMATPYGQVFATGEQVPTLPRERPNILVFLSDDHGRWLQQAYGNSEVKTPTMQRLAQQGVKLTNAYTTSPVCSPARASFFTGRMPSQHGIHDWIEERQAAYKYPWLQGEIILPELLQAAGYRTGLVGKWHCGAERVPHKGFDFWFSYWVSQYPHAGTQNFSDQGQHVMAEGFQAPLLSAQAQRFLLEGGKEPFFLFVGFTDTHSPHRSMPAELMGEYEHATFCDIPKENFLPVHGVTQCPVSNRPEVEADKLRQYYAAASSIDREMGKILDWLDAAGKLDNTCVVYTSDHGLNAGHHGIWEKGNATIPQNFFEESIRVPCTIAWPDGGVGSNVTSALAVNHCDLFATLLDVADVQLDDLTKQKINSPGRSYLSHLRGLSDAPVRQDVICEYGNARMIVCDQYKLVLRFPFKNRIFGHELYDLRDDPRETTNIFSHQSQSARIEYMSKKLHDFFKDYHDQLKDGLCLEGQPEATSQSPWILALSL
ncbi:sulfatase-like hydrolase/transferase [Acetobacter sp.]|uniref:sulfatase-like hydrolase/transferase n=1 Tax=Acetobacter sp. TaxID=440 RepID=UPI0039EB9ADB